MPRHGHTSSSVENIIINNQHMDLTPFPEEHQLNGELHIDQTRVSPNLRCVDGHATTLPGQPRVQVDSASINTHLEKTLWVTELDRLAPKLWLVSFHDCSVCLRLVLT